jgi:hypothetical protein
MIASSAAMVGMFKPPYLWQAARMFAACVISYGVSELIGFDAERLFCLGRRLGGDSRHRHVVVAGGRTPRRR